MVCPHCREIKRDWVLTDHEVREIWKASGAELRRDVPRVEQGKSRIQELLPVRYGRMRADPFAFLRGAAAVMAADTC